MKKLFIFLAISISSFDVWSQSKLLAQCKFGFKFGSGMQAITGCPIKVQPRVAFMGGFWVQIKVSKSWTMQTELINIGKGTGLGFHKPKYGDYWLNLYYCEVPVLFQFNRKNVYYEFGPGIAALINSGEYTNGTILPYQAELYPFSNRDISLNLGAGRVINEKWRVGLRLTHSVLPVRQQLPAASRPVFNRGIILALSRQIHFKASKAEQSQDPQ